MTFEELITWRESSTSGEAIGAALGGRGPSTTIAVRLLETADRIVVTGAGSSYYLAQSVAAAARSSLRRSVIAAPLSELILRPSGVLAGSRRASSTGEAEREPVIIISRSGSTTEAVSVAERMRAAGHPTIAVTCRAGSPLAGLADVTIVSPAGDEEAIVMTRSFASMLALLLRLVALVGPDQRLAEDLDRLSDRWPEAVAAAGVGRRLGATSWSRIVVLGGGPAFGIAAEWGLKLTETSQVPTNAYEPLEFRHGPISVCEPGMLVVGLVGGPGAGDEVAVLQESARFGAATWTIARDEAESGGASGDVSLIGRGLHPSARLPLLLHPGHALALSLALTRGSDPDTPRHLGHVVILNPE